MPDADAAAEASAYLLHCMKEQNSSGGIVECIVNGLPTGLGDPVSKNWMLILEKQFSPLVL